jgi:adenosylmethionine-8-amino-7-oxononanoate aminotransferase
MTKKISRPSKNGKASTEEMLSQGEDETIASRDKDWLWHPFTQMKDWLNDEPLVIDGGQGVYLYDAEGNRYLDAVSSLWANLHGHRVPAIDDAVWEQLGRIAHSTLLGLSNGPAVELAGELLKLAPSGLSRVFYSGDGACAVEAALKMSYQYWRQKGAKYAKKKRFMSFANGYHGDTLGAVSVGGIESFHGIYADLVRPSIKIPYAYCYRCHLDLSHPSCGLQCAVELEPYFEKHSEEVAALIMEPKVQGAAGMVVAPDGFTRAVRDLCTKYEVHLIADEVATGFGRTGTMFACEHDKVSPDILCLGKGITGGYMAQAATLATEEIFEGFIGEGPERKTLYHGHTYAGNPLACAAGLGSLQVFRDEQVMEGLPAKIDYLREKLLGLRELPLVGDVRQAGFIVGLELVSDKSTKAAFAGPGRTGALVTAEMKRRRVISRPLGDVVPLVLPLAVEAEDIDLAVDVLGESIEEVHSQPS